MEMNYGKQEIKIRRHTPENATLTAWREILTYFVNDLFEKSVSPRQTECVHESCNDRVKPTSISFPCLIISLTLCPTAPLQKCNAAADRFFSMASPKFSAPL